MTPNYVPNPLLDDFAAGAAVTTLAAWSEDLDEWFAGYVAGGGSLTLSRDRAVLAPGDAPVPGMRYLRTVDAAGGDLSGVTSCILAGFEIAGVRRLWGQVTLAGIDSADAALPLKITVLQHYGTGGSPTADVTTTVVPRRVVPGDDVLRPFGFVFDVPRPDGQLGSNGDDHVRIRLEVDFSGASGVAVPAQPRYRHGPMLLTGGKAELKEIDTSGNAGGGGGAVSPWTSIAGGAELVDGTTAQTAWLYNTKTDDSNYERGGLQWDGNALKLTTAAAGTGTRRELRLQEPQIYDSGTRIGGTAVAGAIWEFVRACQFDSQARFTETATPTGTANRAAMFARDNGSGKTQLCVIFGTGAVQVLATEP